MNIDIQVEDGALQGLLSTVVGQLDGSAQSELQLRGAHASRNALTAYHTEFEQRRGWLSPGGPAHGAGRRKTGWGENVAQAWRVGVPGENQITVINDAPQFAWKLHGGIITPKRASKLTIPVHPTAHGRTARSWERVHGTRLFRPRGKDILMANVNGRVTAIYALRDSVTQEPWSGAMPEEEVYATPFVDTVSRALLEAL